MLEIRNIKVLSDDRTILDKLDLKINEGEVHVILGKNGSGKSTLLNIIIGNPKYLYDGKITFLGKDITKELVDKRANMGIFLTFQNPIEIPGIKIVDFLREIKKEEDLYSFFKTVDSLTNDLSLKSDFVSSDLNVNFSGGEKKKHELIQALITKPKLLMLDEIDSGLDINSKKAVSKLVNNYLKESNSSLLMVTHDVDFIKEFEVTHIHMLEEGKLKSINHDELLEIKKWGFLND